MFPKHWNLDPRRPRQLCSEIVRAARLHPAELRYLPAHMQAEITRAERITGKVGRWRLDRRSRRLTDPQERPVALSKSEGKTKSSLLKGKKIDE